MKKLLYLSFVICFSFVLAACGSSKEQKSDSIIKVGVLAPLTGVNAEYGKGFDIATRMAADKINSSGGINGKTIKLIVKDSKGDQKESSDLCRQFADDKEIMAIIGDFTSGASMANAPIVDEAGIVQLSPTASNPNYASMSDYCFSIMGRQDGEAPFYAKYILNRYLGSKKLGVIYINSDWGKSCYDNFIKQAKIEGLNVVETVNYVQDEKDFSSLITKLRAANPDTICIMDQGAVAQIINQIRGINWDIRITALGPGTSEQLISLSGTNAEGLLLTSPFFFDLNDESLIEWRNEFVSKSGFEPTIHPVCAYDSLYLISEAIKECGDNITRKNIRDNLAKLDFIGVSGPIKFNEHGDITRKYMICGVENGMYVIKEGFDYSKE